MKKILFILLFAGCTKEQFEPVAPNEFVNVGGDDSEEDNVTELSASGHRYWLTPRSNGSSGSLGIYSDTPAYLFNFDTTTLK